MMFQQADQFVVSCSYHLLSPGFGLRSRPCSSRSTSELLLAWPGRILNHHAAAVAYVNYELIDVRICDPVAAVATEACTRAMSKCLCQ